MVFVIIPCKNRLQHLKESLPALLKAKGDWLAVVVDYNCPQGTAEYIKRQINTPKVFPIIAPVDMNEWSLSGARNFGARFVYDTIELKDDDVLFFMDADTIVEPDFFTNNLPHLVPGSFLCGWEYGDATGSCMMYARDFKSINGYNEELKSWGYEDIDLYERLQKRFSMEMRKWQGGISTIKHGDELRNEFHSGRSKEETNIENINIAKTKFKGLYDLE